ncbi:MAG: hypothetical protein ATN31_08280 [Candidatus Epulonipiscioides saccharophilum]|nr:MAG: hypothetical protein ATN31_08280 [Epulopiscium sp. AS2M-Bin001]
MNNNITFLDGALGTSLLKFIPAGGNIFELNINRPDLVEQLHREYIQAGSEIILANTFGINDFSATDTNYTTQELLTSALKIAKSATKGSSTKVALDIGPLIKLLEPYGDLTYEQCSSVYSNILSIVPLCKPDYIFFETFIDLKMLEIVVQLGNQYNIPILVSMSFLPIGKTIMGNSVEDFISAMQQYDNIIAVGLNCSDTPSKLREVVKKEL